LKEKNIDDEAEKIKSMSNDFEEFKKMFGVDED